MFELGLVFIAGTTIEQAPSSPLLIDQPPTSYIDIAPYSWYCEKSLYNVVYHCVYEYKLYYIIYNVIII